MRSPIPQSLHVSLLIHVWDWLPTFWHEQNLCLPVHVTFRPHVFHIPQNKPFVTLWHPLNVYMSLWLYKTQPHHQLEWSRCPSSRKLSLNSQGSCREAPISSPISSNTPSSCSFAVFKASFCTFLAILYWGKIGYFLSLLTPLAFEMVSSA